MQKNVNFKMGETDIGFGLRPNHPLEQKATFNGYPGADQWGEASNWSAGVPGVDDVAQFTTDGMLVRFESDTIV